LRSLQVFGSFGRFGSAEDGLLCSSAKAKTVCEQRHQKQQDFKAGFERQRQVSFFGEQGFNPLYTYPLR
jgi:hypothetical protein